MTRLDVSATGLSDFLDDLSSAAPVPGGGSVAALQAAMAAALLVMVANLTVGRKKYAEVEDRVAAIRDEALGLRDRALQLAEDDVAAYGAVSDAMALPRGDDTQKTERTRRLQDALKSAAYPPLQTVRVAHRVVALARELVAMGNRSAISDVGTAAQAARAAYHGAQLNVEINAAAVTDRVWADSTMAELQRIPPPGPAVDEIMNLALSAIRGETA